ncbi:Protein CBR-MLT-10 [Aphelenchoides fujianensis]|nr:Protein CBR-MLT-10 [Aphelenchoides fujianensis]
MTSNCVLNLFTCLLTPPFSARAPSPTHPPSLQAMILRLLAALLLGVLSLALAEIHGDLPPPSPRAEDGKATRVAVSDTSTLDIYQKWVDTGLSSLMAAVANKRLKRHRRAVITKFGECSRVANSVPLQARCVSRLLKNEIHSDAEDTKNQVQRLTRYGKKNPKEWTGAFRMRAKRQSPAVKKTYDLHSTQQMISPLGGVAKMLMESVLAAKNKTKTVPWQQTVSKLRMNGAKKRQMRKDLEDESEESNDQMAFRGLKKHLMKQEQGDVDADELFESPEKIKAMINRVAKKKNKKPVEKLLQLVRDGVKLGYSLSGQNTTDFENKTMKLISPRFLGVVPEEKNEDELDFLSPSLFSLHAEGAGLENLTSLPNLLRGMTLRDQQHWLDLIMEAAGVNEESEKLEKDVNNVEEAKQKRITNPAEMVDEDGTPLYFTKENATRIGGTFEERKIQTFELLHKTYTKQQLHEMNTTGYAMLRPDQLEMLYGEHSPYNNTKALAEFSNMTHEQMHDFVERDIHSLSEVDKFKIRQKDIVLSPISFTWLVLVPTLASQPLILSPVIFSPLILSPSVFGAVILSPWMFVPLVLAPRVLGTLILSPFIFSPVILTPIILSPLVLSPFILNPVVGSPLILSPFVLSPIIGSPNVLGALIMSPYALSPVLFSPLIAFAAILSPSWLS